MKIEEIFYNNFSKTSGKPPASGLRRLPYRMLAKRTLAVACGVLMCVGSYYYGQKSNRMAMKNFEEKLDVIRSSFEEMHRVQRDLASDHDSQHHLEKRQSAPSRVIASKQAGGAAYIRWGRRDCPADADDTVMMYEGIAAGAHNTNTGGGSNVLCADLNVSYTSGRYRNGNSGSSYLYGIQYQESWSQQFMDMSDIEGGTYYLYDVPCAACMSTGRVTQLMIPGRETCPPGWTKEYTGYIFGSAHTHKHTTDYICIDDKPQVVPGSDGDQTGGLLYIVETQCPSFQCGPYVHGRELRCVVCTI